MRLVARLFLALTLIVSINACSSTVDQRVSAPQVTLQQLTVAADGRWTADLRVQNYSNVAMQFSAIALTLQIGETAAGTLSAVPAMTVGPLSADVTSSVLAAPAGPARIAVANALASGGSISYRLEGTLRGGADGSTDSEYRIRYDGQLSPTPGLVGVLR